MAIARVPAAILLLCVAGSGTSCRHESADFTPDTPGAPALAAPPQHERGAPLDIPVERLRLAELVGKAYGDSIPFPGSAAFRGRWMLDSAPAAPTVGVEERSSGGRTVLVLDSIVGRSRAGRPLWLILDAIRLPVAGDSVVLHTNCGYDQAVAGRRLFALARQIDAYELTDVRAAWLVNRATRRFEAASLVGLRCWNEGWGQ